MVLRENDEIIALALGSVGCCVIVCAVVCCCRDMVRRTRFKEISRDPSQSPRLGGSLASSSLEASEARQQLVTGYAAPIRRLDPFSFSRSKKKGNNGNNAQHNFSKVTSSAEETNVDQLMRLYGSLAGEPENAADRAMQTPTPRSARSTRSKESDLGAVARNLERDESGEAPSRESSRAAGQNPRKQSTGVGNKAEERPQRSKTSSATLSTAARAKAASSSASASTAAAVNAAVNSTLSSSPGVSENKHVTAVAGAPHAQDTRKHRSEAPLTLSASEADAFAANPSQKAGRGQEMRPQLLGKRGEHPFRDIQLGLLQAEPSELQRTAASASAPKGGSRSQDLFAQIELPPPPSTTLPVTPPASTLHDSQTGRDKKFEALDAELNEEVGRSVSAALDSKALHTSAIGLPKSGNTVGGRRQPKDAGNSGTKSVSTGKASRKQSHRSRSPAAASGGEAVMSRV